MDRSRALLIGAVVLAAVLALGWCALAAPVGEISGTVTDDTGEPIVGAHVSIRSDRPLAPGVSRREVTTDSQGAYVIRRVRPGRYDVEAFCTGYISGRRKLTMKAAESASLEFRLFRACRLTGRIIVESGRGPRHATVTMHLPQTSERWSIEVTPRADGRYAVECPRPGVYDVSVRASGYAPVERRGVQALPGAPVEDLDFLLAAAATTIAGVVYEPDGTTPAPGAAVRLIMMSGPQGKRSGARLEFWSLMVTAKDRDRRFAGPAPRADSEGAFSFDDLDEGTYRIVAHAPGHLPGAAEPIVAGPSEQIGDVAISLRRPASISGILYGVDGHPLARQSLNYSMQTHTDAGPGGIGRSITTDELGRYTLGRLRPGHYWVWFYPPGALPGRREVDVLAGADITGFDLRFTTGEEMRVSVVAPDGGPTAGAVVFVSVLPIGKGGSRYQSKQLTDGRGQAMFTGLPALRYGVRVTAEGALPAETECTLSPGAESAVEVRVALQLPPRIGVRGTVEAGDDIIPTEGLYVFAVRPGRRAVLAAYPGDRPAPKQGHAKVMPGQTQWQILGLEPGEYHVFTYAPGLAPSVPSQVTVEQGEVAETVVGIALPGTIVGRVTSVSGEPLHRAKVSARSEGGRVTVERRSVPSAYVRTDENGRYRFEGLTPGPVTMIASADGYVRAGSHGVTVLPGKTVDGVDFQLGLAGEVRGSVRHRDGRPAGRGYVVELTRQAPQYRYGYLLGPEGTFCFTHLRPRAYRLALREQDTGKLVAEPTPVTVSAGQIIDDIIFVIDE